MFQSGLVLFREESNSTFFECLTYMLEYFINNLNEPIIKQLIYLLEIQIG